MKSHLESEQTRALIHNVYPQATLTSCEPFAGPHDNLNYDLTLANPGTQVVLKIYTNEASKDRAHKEVFLLRTLTSETGVPVPRLLHYDDSCALLESIWCLLTRLPGQPLENVIHTLDPLQLESLGYETGRYLSRIHQIPLDSYGHLLDPEGKIFSTESDFLAARVTSSLHQPALNALLPPEQRQRIEQALIPAGHPSRARACLIHGQYAPRNIMVQTGATDYHVTGILELEYAKGGSPEEDIAHLLYHVPAPSPGYEKGLFDGYVEGGSMDAAFWERLNHYRALTTLEALADGRLSDQKAQRAIRDLASLIG